MIAVLVTLMMISKKDATVKDLKEEKGTWIERAELLVAMRRQMAEWY